MNRLEFKEVLKAVGINNHILDITGETGFSEEVHFWHNIAIYFSGSYYTIIRGRIPLEVANIICEKYPDNQYGIRVNGGCTNTIPRDYAKDDIFVKEMEEYLEQRYDAVSLLEKSKKARERMLKRNDTKKFIDTYHIDSKEGLVILLIEIRDYYIRQLGFSKTEVKSFDELMAIITKEILKKTYATVTTYEWMQSNSKYSKELLKTILRDKKTVLGLNFRQLINDFDKVINPFINSDIELDDIENYIQKVQINGNVYDRELHQYGKYCYELKITDRKSSNATSCKLRHNGFSYKLEFGDDNEELTVMHYFSAEGISKDDIGEFIYIRLYNKKTNSVVDLRYNITLGLANELEQIAAPITPDQITFVFQTLERATGKASTITIDNMQKNNYSKRLATEKK